MKKIKKGSTRNKKRGLILALDVDPSQAKELINELKEHIEIFKIGSRLFTALGPQVVDWIHMAGRKVFLDLKFHDIPKTVEEAARNAVLMNVWGMTIHTSGGFDMMNAAAKVVEEETYRLKITKPLLFGVTVLTSFSDQNLAEIGVRDRAANQVKRLAFLAQRSGLDGVVASGHEIDMIRKSCGKDFLLVVPGIRTAHDAKGDQKRVMTPKDALDAGANYIVMGRPILEAKNRIRLIQSILKF